MKKTLTLALSFFIIFVANAQKTPGPAERKLLDSVCDCMTKTDLSKVTNKEQATAAFTDCLTNHLDLLPDLAAEKGVDISDQDAMRKVGVELGQSLMKEKCQPFIKLAAIMAKDEIDQRLQSSTTGTFKRIDVKGFNYIVLINAQGREQSYLWLKQFNGSEHFMGTTTKLAGKRLKVAWQEIEVYLPAAKGYYKVKEITAIDIL